MDDGRNEYLDTVLIGGRVPASVVVAGYDDAWPARFEVLADRVRRALGPRVRCLQHIGSTSVPGLAAKPIIDMLLIVDDVQDEAALVPPLEPAGFELRVREPGHRMLRTSQRDVHPHVYARVRRKRATTWTCGTGFASAATTAPCTRRSSGTWRGSSGAT